MKRNRILTCISLVLALTPLPIVYADTGGSNIGDAILGILKDLFYWILKFFSRGITDGITAVAANLFTLELTPLSAVISGANLFVRDLAFSVAQFSFFFSLGLYVLPLSVISEDWKAKGENGLIDSCLCIVLLSFTPVIHGFFHTFTSLLSEVIMQSVDQGSFAGSLGNLLLTLITPGSFLILLLDMIFLLVAFALIAVSLILRLMAPTIFLIALCVYALPLRMAKNTANRLFAESIVCYFMEPLGRAILVLNHVLISTVISPLTPLIILILDITILHTAFSISRDVGATYPVIGSLKRTMTRTIILGTLYVAPGVSAGARIVGTSYLARNLVRTERRDEN